MSNLLQIGATAHRRRAGRAQPGRRADAARRRRLVGPRPALLGRRPVHPGRLRPGGGGARPRARSGSATPPWCRPCSRPAWPPCRTSPAAPTPPCASSTPAPPPSPRRRCCAARDAFGCDVVQGYGLTEGTAGLTGDGAGGLRPGPDRTGRTRLRAVGRPLLGTELRIVDAARPAPARPAQLGEIVARGPQLMRGYWNRPAATAEALRGGWLHTGDVGRAGRRRLPLHPGPPQGRDRHRRAPRSTPGWWSGCCWSTPPSPTWP